LNDTVSLDKTIIEAYPTKRKAVTVVFFANPATLPPITEEEISGQKWGIE
jgi:hypothetical protein